MSRFIELTDQFNGQMLVAVEAIGAIIPRDNGVEIHMRDGEMWEIVETYEQVRAMLMGEQEDACGPRCSDCKNYVGLPSDPMQHGCHLDGSIINDRYPYAPRNCPLRKEVNRG